MLAPVKPAPSQLRVATSLLATVFVFAAGACGDAKPGPTAVEPDDGDTPATPADDTAPVQETSAPDDADTRSDTPPPDNPPGAADVAGVWVDDANGVPVGLLIRRGSDDATASRAIYDFITVYDPVSGLFFELTMTDAEVRYPPNTFFDGFSCQTPIGIGNGPCQECRSAWNLAFRHQGKWYKLRGGATFETRGPGSVLKGGIATECVAHGTANAKVFVVDPLLTNAPPASFAAPLRIVAR
jgi:hypothetical protein